METVRLARMAMASRFELILRGEDPVRLRAAGEEALDEIQRLDRQLSSYNPASDISRLNQQAATGPVRVEARLFRLLQRAQGLYQDTDGAFDITVGPLMRCWGFVNNTGHLPTAKALADARAVTGMPLVTLDEDRYSVSFKRPGVLLDLGGIGKGYAIDEAVTLLKEAGVAHAFVHGGTSTIHAFGVDENDEPWKVALPYPDAPPGEPDPADLLGVVPLRDTALSVSAVWGKSFEADGKVFGHVLDPRLGRPVDGAVLTAVTHPSATDADALSTALLVLGQESRILLPTSSTLVQALALFSPDEHGRFPVLQKAFPFIPSAKLRPYEADP